MTHEVKDEVWLGVELETLYMIYVVNKRNNSRSIKQELSSTCSDVIKL